MQDGLVTHAKNPAGAGTAWESRLNAAPNACFQMMQDMPRIPTAMRAKIRLCKTDGGVCRVFAACLKGSGRMAVTKKQYAQMANVQSPNSPIVKNCVWAFCTGGAICTVGQIMTNIYQQFGLKELDASNAATITLVFLGAFLTGLHVYDKLAKYAGAGSLVPITGFANAVVSPALEYKSEGFVLGLGAKMFTIAGPVLVYGITASILYGLVLWIFKLF